MSQVREGFAPTQSDAELASVLECAHMPTLLAVIMQLCADTSWLTSPIRPKVNSVPRRRRLQHRHEWERAE